MKVYCEGSDSAVYDDEVRHMCPHQATVEVFSIHGQWQPMCDRHARGYVGVRRRGLSAAYDEQEGTP